MTYQHSQERFQLQMRSTEEFISKDNPVRFIDAFVEQIDLARLGFLVSAVKIEGRPAFDPKVFLKLYFYGYRLAPITKRACLSTDECKTWDVENQITLTKAFNPDMGCPSSVQLPDNCILTVYYQADDLGGPTVLLNQFLFFAQSNRSGFGR